MMRALTGRSLNTVTVYIYVKPRQQSVVMQTYIIFGYFVIVDRAHPAISSERCLQTPSTEEVSTLGLHWVPHGKETYGTLVPLQKLGHESCSLKTALHRTQFQVCGLPLNSMTSFWPHALSLSVHACKLRSCRRFVSFRLLYTPLQLCHVTPP